MFRLSWLISLDGEKHALCLSFTLPASSYATIVFRELTKQSSFFEKRNNDSEEVNAEDAVEVEEPVSEAKCHSIS